MCVLKIDILIPIKSEISSDDEMFTVLSLIKAVLFFRDVIIIVAVDLCAVFSS